MTEELRRRDDWPEFLGSAPIQSFLSHTNDPDGLRRKVVDRIGRAIINHLKKANRQLEAYSKLVPRNNVVGALVIVNEDHEIYDPKTVAYVIAQALRRVEEDFPLYRHVDLVIYLTERHAQVTEKHLAFPTLIVEGLRILESPWKAEVGTHFLRKWATWNGRPFLGADAGIDDFISIEDIPEMAPRHERWRTDYRRRPYLRSLTKDQLRDRFDEVLSVLTMAFMKDSPRKPPKEMIGKCFEQFTHLMVEMAERAIPTLEFRMEPTRLALAAKRLKLPVEIVDWFVSQGRS